MSYLGILFFFYTGFRVRNCIWFVLIAGYEDHSQVSNHRVALCDMLLFWSCYNPSIHFFRNLQKRSFTRRECDGPPNTRSVYSTGRRLYYNLKTKRHPLSLRQLTGAAQGNSVIRDLRMVLVHDIADLVLSHSAFALNICSWMSTNQQSIVNKSTLLVVCAHSSTGFFII
jgi:hypothetical protein